MIFTTLNTIITDLLKIIRASNISSSEDISKRQLEDWVHQYRSVLLKRDLDKGKKPNPDYIQEIPNLKLEKVDLVGDNLTSLGVESGAYIFKTVLEIPKTLDLNFTSGFTYIGGPAGHEFQFIPEGRSKWQRYKKYTPNDRMAFLRNGHLYVINQGGIEFITVRGVFEIPTEVSRFTNPIVNQSYFNLDYKYPIPNNLIPILKEMILSKELKIEVTSPTDVTNDDKNNPEQVINK